VSGSSSAPDLDRILAAIRDEAARRGAASRPGIEVRDARDAGSGFARRPALAGEPRHVRDYVALSTERLLDSAYRRLLNRPPDPTGTDAYRRALRTGRRTKVEVLARIRYSEEGRRNRAVVVGLAPALALAMIYRLPFLGWIAAIAASVLRLPPHLRDRADIERAAQEITTEIES
jgi:hypothetical protein